MAIIEVRTRVTHRYLMNKSKADLADWVLRLIDGGCPDDVLEAVKDHYWDTLEPDRDLVIAHIEAIVTSFRR